MKTNFTLSFDQLLSNGEAFNNFLETLTSFSPGRSELESKSLKSLLDQIRAANASLQSRSNAVNNERARRLEFFKGPNGLISRSAQIRDYLAVVLQDSKKDKRFIEVRDLVMKMRGVRYIRKKKSDNTGEELEGTTNKTETGYSAIIKHARLILNIIKAIPEYSPVNTKIQISEYENLINSLNLRNNSIETLQERYSDEVIRRRNLYKELLERKTRIKLAISVQYGKDSEEYLNALKY